MILFDGNRITSDYSPSELVRFAQSVGLKRDWIQSSEEEVVHYNINSPALKDRISKHNKCREASTMQLILSGVKSEAYKAFLDMGGTNMQKKGKKPMKRLQRRRKPTGELKVFKEIWAERLHVSEISGRFLPFPAHAKWIWCFSHILPKGNYPELRLDKSNIVLMAPAIQPQDECEHTLWEHHKSSLRDKKEWQWVFEQEELLKIAYNAR